MVPGIWRANQYSNGGLNADLLTKWWSEYQTTMVSSGPYLDKNAPGAEHKICAAPPPLPSRQKGRMECFMQALILT